MRQSTTQAYVLDHRVDLPNWTVYLYLSKANENRDSVFQCALTRSRAGGTSKMWPKCGTPNEIALSWCQHLGSFCTMYQHRKLLRNGKEATEIEKTYKRTENRGSRAILFDEDECEQRERKTLCLMKTIARMRVTQADCWLWRVCPRIQDKNEGEQENTNGCTGVDSTRKCRYTYAEVYLCITRVYKISIAVAWTLGESPQDRGRGAYANVDIITAFPILIWTRSQVTITESVGEEALLMWKQVRDAERKRSDCCRTCVPAHTD